MSKPGETGISGFITGIDITLALVDSVQGGGEGGSLLEEELGDLLDGVLWADHSVTLYT